MANMPTFHTPKVLFVDSIAGAPEEIGAPPPFRAPHEIGVAAERRRNSE